MARSLGIPSRVAVGFTPGTPATACSTCSRTTRTRGPRSGSPASAGPISSTPRHPPAAAAPPRAAAAARRRDDRAAGRDSGRRDHAPRPADFGARRRNRRSDNGDHERAGSPARHHDRAGQRLAAVARGDRDPRRDRRRGADLRGRRDQREVAPTRARRRDAAEPAVAVQGAWDEALDKLREAHVPPDPALTPLELARAPRGAGSPRRRGRCAAWRAPYTVVRYGGGSASSADADARVGRGRRARPRARRGAHADANGGAAASTRRRSVPGWPVNRARDSW